MPPMARGETVELVPYVGVGVVLENVMMGAESGALLAVSDPNGDLATPRNPANDHFPADRIRDLAGAQASRDAVMGAMAQCAYASFFTHAWWEPDRPERASLPFFDPDPDATPPPDISWSVAVGTDPSYALFGQIKPGALMAIISAITSSGNSATRRPASSITG